jgi:hypothetical protein
VLFREGRLDEAIDLERAATQRAPRPVLFSQLDRFLRARGAGQGAPVLIGNTSGDVTLSVDPKGTALVVELRTRLEYGFVLVARRASDSAMIRVSTSPSRETSYRLDLSPIASTAQFDLALLDARGCDDCEAGTWHFDYAVHDAAVDRYP